MEEKKEIIERKELALKNPVETFSELSEKEVNHHMSVGKGQVSVEPEGKLATTWSQLKRL